VSLGAPLPSGASGPWWRELLTNGVAARPSPLRLLLDLSYGALGYCGIAQETRLLLKVFREYTRLESTGLLFGVNHNVLRARLASSGSPDRILERQATYLHRLLEGKSEAANWFLRGWRHLADWAASLCRFNARLRPMDSHYFWDVLWRRVLAKTLEDDDLSKVCDTPILLANLSARMMQFRALTRLPSPRLDTSGHDFALFHVARAVRVSSTTCKLVRHYDLIPLVRPDLAASSLHIKIHTRSVRRAQHDSVFTCISESARNDLIQIFPALGERSVTIPCTLASGYYPEYMPSMIPLIIDGRQSKFNRARRATRPNWQTDFPPYLLAVSTIEPRKNYIHLFRAFETLLARYRSDLRLVVVGNLGSNSRPIRQAMEPLIRRGRLIHLDGVPLPELRILYSHAVATVFPSLYEGFGYSPLESMCCDTPAIVSDIAAHRGVYGEAALYCDPYRADSIASAVEQLCLEPDNGLRDELIGRGRRRVARYRAPAVAAQWLALLEELRRQGITSNVGDARLAGFNEALRAIEDEQERRAADSEPAGSAATEFRLAV
jgi:glycosyltransferase involved in cell wall biosynthesis